MGYDDFGLPAKRTFKTSQRPEDTTSVNIDGVDKEETKLRVP
jgi:hypothetical protein